MLYLSGNITQGAITLEHQDRIAVPHGLSREQELLLLAVRPVQDSTVQDRIQELLAAGPDWTELVRAALGHRLIPRFAASLQALDDTTVPGDILHALEIRGQRNRAQCRCQVEAVTELAAAAREQAIDVIFVHGPALAVAAFGAPERQEAVNPVVLLAAGDLPRLAGIMETRGYRLRRERDTLEPLPPWGECEPAAVFARDDDGLVIEAYTSLAAPTLAVDLDYAACRARAVTVDIGGTPVPALAPEDLLLALCLTGASREWRLFETPCAVAGLLASNPGIDLGRVRERAREAGAGRMLALGLALVQETLGVAVHAPVDGGTWLRRELEGCRQRLLADLREEPASGFSRSRLRLHERIGDRCRYAVRALRAPPRVRIDPRSARPGQATTPETARAINKSHWGKRSESWQHWSEKTQQQSAETSRLLMEAAGVARGQRVLDLACGVGDTSLEAGPVVGPDGFVMATDLAYDMISKARSRALAGGLGNLHFCTTAMENLPFIDRQFDAIVCRLGIMYCARVERALAESLRVLRAGGRAAWLVCGPREDNTLLRIVHEVSTDLFELERQDDEGVISPFRFSAAGRLAGYLERAGFAEVTELELVKELYPPVGYRFWQAGLERGLGIPLDQLPAETLGQLDERMTAAFEPYRQGDSYRLVNLSWIVVGCAPGA